MIKNICRDLEYRKLRIEKLTQLDKYKNVNAKLFFGIFRVQFQQAGTLAVQSSAAEDGCGKQNS